MTKTRGRPYIEVVKAQVDPPARWYFRVRWGNGRIALTSELYNTRGTCTKLANKFAVLTSLPVGVPGE